MRTWSHYLTNNMCSIEAELGGGIHTLINCLSPCHTCRLIFKPWYTVLATTIAKLHGNSDSERNAHYEPSFYLRTHQQSSVENLNWCSNVNIMKRSFIVVQLLSHVQNEIVNNARPGWNSHGLMEHKFTDSTCFSFGICHMVRSVVNNR